MRTGITSNIKISVRSNRKKGGCCLEMQGAIGKKGGCSLIVKTQQLITKLEIRKIGRQALLITQLEKF